MGAFTYTDCHDTPLFPSVRHAPLVKLWMLKLFKSYSIPSCEQQRSRFLSGMIRLTYNNHSNVATGVVGELPLVWVWPGINAPLRECQVISPSTSLVRLTQR